MIGEPMAFPRSPAEVDDARNANFAQAIGHAWRSPFFRRRLKAAGLSPGEIPSPAAWQRIQPTTKDELRALGPAEFTAELVIADQADIATYWRSGGVTGRPLFYPKHRDDFPALIESFARVLDVTGIGRGDLVHNSFPFLGMHPIGHMFGNALRDRGCGQISAGSGANTPTEVQVGLIYDLRPRAWLGIGSYINILGHRAEAMGYDPASSPLRTIVSSAESLTPAKRARMEHLWNAELFDSYGMTECSMMGCECNQHNGLHIWTDLFLVEILDPVSWRPLPVGEPGVIVVTPLHSMAAIPFLRWASGDIGAIEPGCSCLHGMFPRLRLAARTMGFSKVRGININHNDMEDLLLGIDTLADYLVRVETHDLDDRLLIDVEAAPGCDQATVADVVRRRIEAAFELKPDIALVDRGTIAVRLESDVKQVRFRDDRMRQ